MRRCVIMPPKSAATNSKAITRVLGSYSAPGESMCVWARVHACVPSSERRVCVRACVFVRRAARSSVELDTCMVCGLYRCEQEQCACDA
mmetsp:Transcript_28792/g.59026  ORF Transcript_28792/g.59026 Transcript_28792/m.59026 type:complete len:89 (+) Transcript_28792:221-487(+)